MGSLAWADTSPDMLDPVEVAGPTTASHHDGALFDEDGHPVYCQLMSMHWDVRDANTALGREVVAEYRDDLNFPVHLFAECQAVNAIENNPFGRFLTPNGFVISTRPTTYEFFNADLPFAQMDGPFVSVGGSEPSYSLPPGDSYRDGDVVMISGEPPGRGTRDVWMTGFAGGGCSILSESCDPSLPQGKVSYLGGHQYTTTVPISANPQTQGTRLFLNSLFEAPCASDLGQPTVAVAKSGPAVVEASTVTWMLTYFNGGPGIALRATLIDVLPSGATFVSASGGGTWDGTRVTWNLRNLGPGESGVVTVTARLSSFGTYANSATLDYRSGVTPFSVRSNVHTTCFHPPGDPSSCERSASATARACSDGRDTDGDGRVDEEDAAGALCPPGASCIGCSCVLPCIDSEFGPCPVGRIPLRNEDGRCFCVTPRCDEAACSASTIRNAAGEIACAPAMPGIPVCTCREDRCSYPCENVACEAPLVCHPEHGVCVPNDCTGLGCRDDELCDEVPWSDSDRAHGARDHGMHHRCLLHRMSGRCSA
jgi:uncharacterized repeat protein (TIGR01451 family)